MFFHLFLLLLEFVTNYIIFSSSFQLSSKCDNRLFRIRFDVLKMEKCPFLKALSPPIRCISRNKNPRISSMTCKRTTVGIHPTDISQLSMLDEDDLELQRNSCCEAKPNSISKRIRVGQDRISATFRADPNLEPPDEECNSHWNTNQVYTLLCHWDLF